MDDPSKRMKEDGHVSNSDFEKINKVNWMLMKNVGEAFGHFGQQHPHFVTNITVTDQ